MGRQKQPCKHLLPSAFDRPAYDAIVERLARYRLDRYVDPSPSRSPRTMMPLITRRFRHVPCRAACSAVVQAAAIVRPLARSHQTSPHSLSRNGGSPPVAFLSGHYGSGPGLSDLARSEILASCERWRGFRHDGSAHVWFCFRQMLDVVQSVVADALRFSCSICSFAHLCSIGSDWASEGADDTG